MSLYGRVAGDVAAADRAVALTPSDPYAHESRAVALAKQNRAAEAVREMQEAVSLRPRDYRGWLRLGAFSDEAGNTEGAVAAFRESARLAPTYADPRWFLGNTLLRVGRREEAFSELRQAAASDPERYPKLIDLLWQAGRGDARYVEERAAPRNAAESAALARYFARRGLAREAVRLSRAAGGEGEAAERERRALLTQLLSMSRFVEAYQVWLAAAGGEEDWRQGVGRILNGGFEAEVRADTVGFDWQFARDGVRLSLDAESPREGARSLRIEFSGNSNPSSAVVSQLVLVEPGARYRLTFSARAQGLITGGLPQVSVAAANTKGDVRLAASPAFGPEAVEWKDFTIEFATPAGAEAVRLSLVRQPCSSSPCPAFGSLWLDGFALNKI